MCMAFISARVVLQMDPMSSEEDCPEYNLLLSVYQVRCLNGSHESYTRLLWLVMGQVIDQVVSLTHQRSVHASDLSIWSGDDVSADQLEN